ncbi:hypothetical protein ACFZDG_14050 [Kitasatospora xanthocidica]|uniref:hypothetical protein n=1 Tax=Kitasatospora xanthocidica TaxID=83382 RepID=UPI0036E7FE1F
MREMTGRITKAVVAGAIAVSGMVVGTGSAHADSAYACRSWNTHGRYVPVLGNAVYLDSCYSVLSDGRTIEAQIPFSNYTGQGLTYCAHALDVNNLGGPWPHDFGCTSSANTGDWVWAGNDPGYGPSWSDWTAPAGTYVISTGVWVDGHYYGDVQSPRTTIG